MARTTKQVTAPSGAVIELKEYITAGEFLDIQEAAEKDNLTKTQVARRLMETAVVSLNGVKENVSQLLRDLPISDYTFLANEMKSLVDGDFTQAKSQ